MSLTAQWIKSFNCRIDQHDSCGYSATKGDWRCRCRCHPPVAYAISAEAGRFYRAYVEEPETVWRPVLAWTTEEGKPIRYVFTGDNHGCEAEALARAEVLRGLWESRDRKRQLIIRVDGEIGDCERDDLKASGAPSLTQWHMDREYQEMNPRGGEW